MSREIKFRAWHDGQMLYLDKGDFIITERGALPTTISNQAQRKIELMQFTGLHDRNGKKLYHFDLIVNQSRNKGNPHIIDWSNKYGAWVGKYNETEYLLAQEQNEINYCGNCFEHPELLEAKQK